MAKRKTLAASGLDYDNSIRFEIADLLSSEHASIVMDLALNVIDHAGLERVGKAITVQFETTLSAVLANLLRAHALDRECFVVISLDSAHYTESDYNCQGIGYTNFRRVIDFLKKHSPPLIDYHAGYYDPKKRQGKRTRIRITDYFLDYLCVRMDGRSPSIFDIVPNPNFKIIRLKDTKKNKKRLLDFKDDDLTAGMRKRLEKWNAFLGEQWTDIYVSDEQFKNIYRPQNELDDDEDEYRDDNHGLTYVDLTRRRLYRAFNNRSFDQGGRFYGGWWQSIPSEWRPYITINWHPTRELDYSSMQPSMLYAKVGLPLKSYAYNIDGVPLTELNKRVIKKTFLQIINAKKGMKAPTEDQLKDLPSGWNWNRLREAIEAKHDPIKQFFRSGIGIELQRLDADIAEEVMLSMMKMNTLVLPVHDSFLVRSSYFVNLKDEMRAAYRRHVGQDIEISLDLSYEDNLQGPSQIVSKFKDIDSILDRASEIPEGYEGYFARKLYVKSRRTARAETTIPRALRGPRTQ